VNPVVLPRLHERNVTFDNAAVIADVAKAPRLYRAAWFGLGNATSALRSLSEYSSPTTTLDAAVSLPTKMGSLVAVDIAADGTDDASWRRLVRACFHRQPKRWDLVEPDRLPSGPTTLVASRR